MTPPWQSHRPQPWSKGNYSRVYPLSMIQMHGELFNCEYFTGDDGQGRYLIMHPEYSLAGIGGSLEECYRDILSSAIRQYARIGLENPAPLSTGPEYWAFLERWLGNV